MLADVAFIQCIEHHTCFLHGFGSLQYLHYPVHLLVKQHAVAVRPAQQPKPSRILCNTYFIS